MQASTWTYLDTDTHANMHKAHEGNSSNQRMNSLLREFPSQIHKHGRGSLVRDLTVELGIVKVGAYNTVRHKKPIGFEDELWVINAGRSTGDPHRKDRR